MSTLLMFTLALVFGGCSCGDDDATDTGPMDTGTMMDGGMDTGGEDTGGTDTGGTDTGVADTGGPDTNPPRESSVTPTSGGGNLENAAYKLRVSVGGPQPVGSAADGTTRLRVGPQPR